MKTNNNAVASNEGFQQPQQYSIQLQNQPDSQQPLQSQDKSLEDDYNDIQLQDLESTIAQLQKISENPSTNARMSSNECSNQLLILLEKYSKIEQMVSNDQESINQLIKDHLQLQQNLQTEYVSYQNVIAQGKHDIIQISLVNKQALLYQTKGAQATIGKQNEAENLSKEIVAIQRELQNVNQRVREKVLLEKTLEEQNMRFTSTIEEFKNDQGEQKEGVERFRQSIQQGENEIKLVKKEQLDMQRKLEFQRKNRIEKKQKTVQFNNAREVVIAELKNEKKMLQLSQRKYEGLTLGLQSLEQEIERTNEHLEQIRQVNEDTKKQVQFFSSSTVTMGSQNQGDEEEEQQEVRELESLLEDQSNVISGNQAMIGQKEGEKEMLEGHLSQLSVFAQKYLERLEQESKQQELVEQQQQQQQQQMEEQEEQENEELLQRQEEEEDQEQQYQFSKNGIQQEIYELQCGVQVAEEVQEDSNIAVVKDEEQGIHDENIHNIHAENNWNEGMELAQSQNEQSEQISPALDVGRFNAEQSLSSKQSTTRYCSSSDHQISLKSQPLQDTNQQSDKKPSNENSQIPQGKLEEQQQDECELSSKEKEEKIEGQECEQKIENNSRQEQYGDVNNLQSTIQANLDSLQGEVDAPSDTKRISGQKQAQEEELNIQGIDQEQHHIFEQTGSFGGHVNENFEESPVKEQNYSPFVGLSDNSELDSEQQQIANEFSKGDIQVSSTIQLAEFIRQQEEKEKREKNKNNNNNNDNQGSTPSDSSKVLSQEHKRIMAQISIPGMGYQKIFNNIKNSMQKSDLLEQKSNGQLLQQNQQLNEQK